jgi:phosphodiesterase/alkaline phosphatase D-like protein
MGGSGLVLGPLVRYVDEHTVTVWVEVSRAAEVVVRAAGRTWSARTFAVHGRHYALVDADGLEPGAVADYTVAVEDETVWPPPDAGYPPSRLATLKQGKPLRLAFGSCRTSVGHDEAGNSAHGVDALRAYALRMMATAEADPDAAGAGAAGRDRDEVRRWPDLVTFLGDQVYADETTEEMRAFIASRRDIDEPPGTELADYEEYAHLYWLAWSDPANRWLLSTLPSAMIFDDHDIRDDWNTSAAWRRDMAATSWWHDRIVGGLGSYWVYQHLGNLSPAERAKDPLWAQVLAGPAAGAEEVDLTDELDAMAARADREPSSYSWSYAREVGGCRLVVVDSRAARVLEGTRRQMLDDAEMAWLDRQLRGDCEHLLVATSLPFLLPEGIHHFEAWSEGIADGGWGRRGRWLGERLRRAGDLEHWAAFQQDFGTVLRMVTEVADGARGAAPRTVTFLSGDVHHSYIAEVHREQGSRILQAVCSPMRNPLPMRLRYATAVAAYGVASPLGALAARSARVPRAPARWSLLARPHYDNNLATLQVDEGGYDLVWESGVVVDGDHAHPELREVARVRVTGRHPVR